MERDSFTGERFQSQDISTHTLTWSVTKNSIVDNYDVYDFNSHAHVERDRRKKYPLKMQFNFNSHAHVERDRVINVDRKYTGDFNSHAHVERD